MHRLASARFPLNFQREMGTRVPATARDAVAIVALAAVYVAAARLGLMMDAVAGFATLVWPPTGIALAALLLLGPRLWPGVFVGALVANLWNGAPLLVALGIAAGNTLEAVVGTHALRRVSGFRPTLDRVRDALALILLAGLASTLISASVGVLSLHQGGIVPPERVRETWRAWWTGDVLGDLVVAPLLLVWASDGRPDLWKKRPLEGLALFALMVLVVVAVFGTTSASDATRIGRPYLLFPPLIWAALRFGQHGVVTATSVTAAMAILETALGNGPFARVTLNESLLGLQTFMGVAAGTTLLLGASIAERRRAEERLRRAHATVAEANRAKSEFLAVMSHELRTPLNAITGYVELLLTTAGERLDDAQRSYLTRIRTNEQHLLRMIEDVLSFAKIEAGKLTLATERVLVADTLGELEAMVEPDLRRKRIAYRCDPCDPALAAEANPERLRQVLLNLVANAIKFTPEGGAVRVAAEQVDGRVRILVSDTGIGIAANQLERVFEPFFQVDRGTKRSYPGIGLGLAIARDLARAMGGDVRMESELGKGTTALVELRTA